MKKILLVLGLLFLLIPATSFAAEFRSADNKNGNITIEKGEVLKNLYVAGGNVTVDSETNGDLVAAGGVISINGDVENSLIAGGGNLNIKNNIGQNMRVGGGSVFVESNIGGDLFVGGGSVDISKNSEIKGDLVVAGGSVKIDGKVNGKIYLTGGDVTLNGQVLGDVKAREVKSLTIGNGADIGGKLSYSSPNEATILQNAKIAGGIDYSQINKVSFGPSESVAKLWNILMSLIAVLVLMLVLPKWSQDVVENSYSSSIAKMGKGFVAFIVAPIAFIFLLATLVGVKIAFIFALLYIVLAIFASLLAPLIAGSYFVKFLRKQKMPVVDWLAAVLGVVVLSLVGMIPVIGWIVVFLVFLLALGQLLDSVWGFLNLQRK